MEKVIIYTRVSTDEQSLGYSLRDQKDKLDSYCTNKQYSTIAHYEDDHSAKTFDRPAFQKLFSFIKKNKGLVSKLVFARWDRFSRNITDALLMIRELSKLGIECEAADQPLDLTIPENKLLLTIYLSAPEVENDRRSLNTINGTRRAMKEGRWCNAAPFGYRYTRDERNKPLLIPNGAKADLIREAFELYATGQYTKEEVRRMLKPKGMTLQNAHFSNIFHNHLYIGKIVVKEYKNEPEQLVSAVHEPLVSEAVFNNVQRIAAGKKALFSKPNTVTDDLPLRGFLQCPVCGGNLTGSASRSRNKTRHYYYHCQPPCKTRFRADKANDAFEAWLVSISILPERADRYLQFFEMVSKQHEGDRKKEVERVDAELLKISELLLKVDKMFVAETLDLDSYKRLKDAYLLDRIKLEQEKEVLKDVTQETIKQMEFAFSILSNLHHLYVNSSLEEKRSLVGSILLGKLIFEDGKYRTTESNPLLDEVFNIDGHLEGLEIEMAPNSGSHHASVASTGIEPVSKV